MRKIGVFIWYKKLHFDGWIHKWSDHVHTPLTFGKSHENPWFKELIIHKSAQKYVSYNCKLSLEDYKNTKTSCLTFLRFFSPLKFLRPRHSAPCWDWDWDRPDHGKPRPPLPRPRPLKSETRRLRPIIFLFKYFSNVEKHIYFTGKFTLGILESTTDRVFFSCLYFNYFSSQVFWF